MFIVTLSRNIAPTIGNIFWRDQQIFFSGTRDQNDFEFNPDNVLRWAIDNKHFGVIAYWLLSLTCWKTIFSSANQMTNRRNWR